MERECQDQEPEEESKVLVLNLYHASPTHYLDDRFRGTALKPSGASLFHRPGLF
jgi:hypothetical protein